MMTVVDQRQDEGERDGNGPQVKDPLGQQRQHGALVADHPADYGVDPDKQQELGEVGAGPAAPAARLWRRESSA